MLKNHQTPEENQQHEEELTLGEIEYAKKTGGDSKIVIGILREMRGHHKKRLVGKSDHNYWTIKTIVILNSRNKSQYLS